MGDTEDYIVVVIILLAMVFIIPRLLTCSYGFFGCGCRCPCRNKQTNKSVENFGQISQNPPKEKGTQGVDPMRNDLDRPADGYPRGSTGDFESLIYDNTTGTIMTGSQFIEKTGVIAPLWVPPAWDPNALGPSSKGELNPDDYDNDPRMIYNKCSLSCCSPQYPPPFKTEVDPFVCGEDGKSKYLSSDYMCTNNAGGTGCLCMTPKQAEGLKVNFVDYYVDEKKLGY